MAYPQKPQTTAERIRELLNGKGYRSLKRIGVLFKKTDSENDRTLSIKELEDTLTEFGVELSKREMENVFSSFDKDADGSISLDEFITALRPPMNAVRRAIVERAFDKMDVTNDGCITIEDLSGVYDVTKHPKFKSGEWTKSRTLKEFMDTFQVSGNKDDKVTRHEFIDYYAMLSAGIDKDVYFDFMVRNAWKL